MAEENKGTGSQASAVPEAESRPYELKQVQVRLRLSEAGSIYSGSGICLCREPGHKKQADQFQHCQYRRYQYSDRAHPEHF